MMLKRTHCIQLMVFLALNEYIGRSMQTKYVKNVTIMLQQVNYCLGYPCVIENGSQAHFIKICRQVLVKHEF